MAIVKDFVNVDIDVIEEQKVNSNEAGIFAIIMGVPGSGKSSMAATFPTPLFADLEGTAGNIKGIKRVRIVKGKKEDTILKDGKEIKEDTRALPFQQLYSYAKAFLASDKYKTLVIDGGVEFTDYCRDASLKKLGRETVRDAKFGDIHIEYRSLAENLIKMIIGKGKHLVLITHMEEITEVDEATDAEYQIRRPLLDDKKLVYKLPALANIVGEVEIDKQGNRVFNCVPSTKKTLKNQFGIITVLPPSFEALNEKVKEFYGS
jgi:hypothetical protein